MTPEQLALVQRTAAVLADYGDWFRGRFESHLLARHPDAGVFAVELSDELLALAAAVADLPEFTDRARMLGERQQGVGLHAADYPLVGEAFVATVAEAEGDGWTQAGDDAWRRLWMLIAETMFEGASSGLFSPPESSPPN